MPVPVSQLEISGSPFEQASWYEQTWYWDPSDNSQVSYFAPGENIVSMFLQVFQYDPSFPEETVDVTATVVAAGSPFIGSGDFANQVGFTVNVGLQPGYSYRCQLGATGDQGSTPAAFSVIRCVV